MTQRLYPFNYLFLCLYGASLVARTTCFIVPSTTLTHRHGDKCVLFVEQHKKRKNKLTMAELIEKAQRNPQALVRQQAPTKNRRRRTRKRVDAPQQEYVYASQRRRRTSTGS